MMALAPALAPEKTTNFTAGIVFQPTPKLTFTADYWYVRVNNVIIGAQPTQAIFDQYYLNNGVVNIPGFTVTQSAVDPLNPNALPLLGTIMASFQNTNALKSEGIDLSATLRVPIGHNGLRWTSAAQATYLSRLEQIGAGGAEQRYDGTLGPCEITSCSGAPKWRAIWSNTLDFNGKASATLTAYYTGPYSLNAADDGGVYHNCGASIGADVVATVDTVTPLQCKGKASFDMDFTAKVKIADHLTLYTNILNVLNQAPSFDPSAGYGVYNFNPAWRDRQFIGRYFRVGAKLDF